MPALSASLLPKTFPIYTAPTESRKVIPPMSSVAPHTPSAKPCEEMLAICNVTPTASASIEVAIACEVSLPIVSCAHGQEEGSVSGAVLFLTRSCYIQDDESICNLLTKMC